MPIPKKVAVDNETLAQLGLRYTGIKQETKRLNNEAGEIRVVLEQHLEDKGVETANGSFGCEIPYLDKNVILKHTRKTSVGYKPEIIDVLKEEGFTDCVESVEIVRNDILEAKVKKGEIPEEIYNRIFDVKDSYAFSVTVKGRYSDEDDPE